ncbi:MAG: acetate/propionate family kinase [Polyangiales bacterium]
MHILVLNSGSSSLKFALFEGALRLASGLVERLAEEHVSDALSRVVHRIAPMGGLARLDAIGHRVVHGGGSFDRATRIDPRVLGELKRLRAIDPDHLPAEIAIIEAVSELAPRTPQVACFDTAFHANMPRVARLLPLPRRYEAAGLRRFGFHGLSYEYLLGELRRLDGELAERRVILAHLGSGASLVALAGGRSIDTTMSFTPNSGVPMGTRSGDLDPGVLVHLLRTESLAPDALDELLSKRAGLLGVSGTSSDMRDLLAREATDEAAADAIALFCHSVKKAIGALATTIDGLDALVFAGGIGEHAHAIRARIGRGLGHLGVQIDADRNERNDTVISTDASRCKVRVIPTNEEAVIARHCAEVLVGGSR